ncbi:serine hydrolase [Paramaledivibacter caminithermalis]|jgi:beta-lactamase class A|uniref:Beta-lactamase class A n=1 Tax=Paramaledivibacter caminithermalis (strain DSM 15212 / CIP 107654 / DViRD3) TaxID=1121301 RepID=A0A1M6LHN7_PARC5|nr:serine hydrolase [Paramaledivibacter caminithermalis]SHJ70697.1 beta-lactamase class A [Paramaledivibacter caminithermalis DSM 15212]
MLRKKIDDIIEGVDGDVGVIVKNLETNESIMINEDTVFPAASVIKLYILWELFERIKKGEFTLEQEILLKESHKVGGFGVLKELHEGINLSLKDIATLMIILSDNTATNILIDLLGMDNINQTIKNNKMKDTVLQRKMMDGEAKAKGFDNYTSPMDVLSILEKSLQREEIIDIMKRQQCNNKLPALIDDSIVIAHKTGDLPAVEHDVGIMFMENSSIIIIVLTKNLKENIEGIKLNNNIGKAVYDYYK